jgi:parallel beta-helix repeat protein
MWSSSVPRRAARALALAFVLLLVAGGPSASATTVRVDNDRAQCPGAGFRTISAALRFAAPGTKILVCPGLYREQLRMSTAGVRVVGLTGDPHDVIVRAPAPLVPLPALPAIVEMTAPSTALENVTVHGNDSIGVFVHNGPGPIDDASVISNVRLRKTGQARALSNIGVQVGNPFNLFDTLVFDPGRAIVSDSRYDGTGSAIAVHAGSTAQIRGNVLVGTRGSAAEQRGIALGDPDFVLDQPPADVDVRDNEIVGFSHVESGPSPDESGSSIGIFVEGHVTGTVGPNRIFDNRVGIWLSGRGTTVADNIVRDNTLAGILLDAFKAQDNQLLRNVARNNGLGAPPGVPPDVVRGDCLDFSTGTGTAATANTWTDNLGGSSFPGGLCRPPEP